MYDNDVSSAPDYSNEALTIQGANLLWIFTALWVCWGMVPVILLALGMNEAISRHVAGDG